MVTRIPHLAQFGAPSCDLTAAMIACFVAPLHVARWGALVQGLVARWGALLHL